MEGSWKLFSVSVSFTYKQTREGSFKQEDGPVGGFDPGWRKDFHPLSIKIKFRCEVSAVKVSESTLQRGRQV